jgi:hypothetical protein
MKNETFQKAVDIQNQIERLKNSFGFRDLTYKDLAENIEEIRVTGKTSYAFHPDQTELFEFCKQWLLKKEEEKESIIFGLEQEFAEL